MKKISNYVYGFSIFLLFLAIWLGFVFGKVSFAAIVFHLSPVGADKIEYQSFISLILLVILFPIFLIWISKNLKSKSKIILAIFYISIFVWHIEIIEYLQIIQKKDLISNYYRPVGNGLNINNRNLVVVYVESLENNFSDESLVGENLITDLNLISDNHFEFLNYNEAYGSDWTIASIVASQCGIPLQLPIERYLGIKDCKKDDSFLKGAKCLGDVLNRNGYKQVFMNGVDLNFAFVGDFFRTHKYDEIYGPEELKKSLNKSFSEHYWGVSDSDLMNVAKEKFRELYDKNEPFNLTLLTIDTHAPKGVNSEYCTQRYGDNPSYGEIIKCSSYSVSNFINFVKEYDKKNNTTILVMGDHLAKKNALSSKINKKSRKIYAALVSNDLEKYTINEYISAVDFYPILLNELSNEKICKAGIGSVPGIRGCGKREETIEDFLNINSSYSQLISSYWCEK